MKVKNIMFSGFAAAILMGTANAATTPFEIASKAYVDKQITDLSGNGGAISEISDAIGNSDMGTQAETITGAIAEIEGRVDTAESDIDNLEAALGEGFGTGAGETTVADALDGKVDKSAVSTAIPATGASDDKWASEKAVADAIATVSGSVDNVQQQIEGALGDLGTHTDPTSGETVPNTVEEVLETKADAEDVGNVENLAQDISANDIVGAINELNTEKQNEADSNVASAGNYIAAGHGVASNLTALDTQLKSTTDTANAAVPRNMNGTNGKALIFNETDGGGAKFEHNDKTWSFTGVNDGGANGIAAQIYAIDKDSKTGARIDVYTDGMYYTVGNAGAGARKVEANKIATIGDIAAVGGNVGEMENLHNTNNDNFGANTDTVVEALNDLDDAINTKADASTVGNVADLTGFATQPASVVAALNDLQANKLNKPIPNTCGAESQHCVLHMDTSGNLSWVDITVPYIEETQTEP